MDELLNFKARFAIVPTYAAILAIIYLVLTFKTIGARREAKVALGTGGSRKIERRIRAHGNFNEFVPLTLTLLAFLELRSAPGLLLHALGAALVLARVSHAYGISQEPENLNFRVGGMVPTLTVLAVAAAVNLYYTVLG